MMGFFLIYQLSSNEACDLVVIQNGYFIAKFNITWVSNNRYDGWEKNDEVLLKGSQFTVFMPDDAQYIRLKIQILTVFHGYETILDRFNIGCLQRREVLIGGRTFNYYIKINPDITNTPVIQDQVRYNVKAPGFR